jgi:hypothetical protein
MHEQSNIQVAHHLKSDSPFQPVAEVKVGEKVLRRQLEQTAVERSRLARTPTVREFKSVVRIEDIPVRGIQFVHGHVTSVDQGERRRCDQALHVTRSLSHAHAGTHHEYRGTVFFVDLIQLGVQPGDRPKVTSEASRHVGEPHDIEQALFRQKRLERRFQFQCRHGRIVCSRPSEDRLAILNANRRITRKCLIHVSRGRF